MNEQLRIIPRREPWEVLERAHTKYKPDAVFVLFSGGKDSTVTLDYLWRNEPGIITGVLHVNTTIASPTTEPFCREFCADRGLEMIVVKPDTTYEELVSKFGMFGPGLHSVPYNALKANPFEKFTTQQKKSRSGKVWLVSGTRADESARRAKTCRETSVRGSTVYVAPLIDFSKADMFRHREEFNVAMSPCAKTLCISGDCFCGAKAHPGEREEIKALEPTVFSMIESAERVAKLAGHKNKVWGERPPVDLKTQMEQLPLSLPEYGCEDCAV